LGKLGRGIWPSTVPWRCNVRPMEVSKKKARIWTPLTGKWMLVIGVMSVADDYKLRQTIRSTWIYGGAAARGPEAIRAKSSPAVVLFVIGVKATKMNNKISDRQLCLLKAEQDVYGDLLMIGINENMNLGKTNDFFQLVYRKIPAEYVMKADQDAFLNIPSLLKELDSLPSCRLYFGFPCEHAPGNNNRDSPSKGKAIKYGSFDIPAGTDGSNPGSGIQAAGWMCGMGFVLSWDLVEFLATSEIVARDASRYASYAGEDIQIGLWLIAGSQDLNFAGDYFKFMDHPRHMPQQSDWNTYAHTMMNDTVLIHLVKYDAQWEDVRTRYHPWLPKDKYSTDLLFNHEGICSKNPVLPSLRTTFYSGLSAHQIPYVYNCTWCLGPGYSCSGCQPTDMLFFTNRSS